MQEMERKGIANSVGGKSFGLFPENMLFSHIRDRMQLEVITFICKSNCN
jgi:hypothetical protein